MLPLSLLSSDTHGEPLTQAQLSSSSHRCIRHAQ
jgi:hypothetical protein